MLSVPQMLQSLLHTQEIHLKIPMLHTMFCILLVDDTLHSEVLSIAYFLAILYLLPLSQNKAGLT